MGTAAVGHHITSERTKRIWNHVLRGEHPPQRHVRKKLESLHRDNRHHIEWIALGFTAKSFWTVARRWIALLESLARFGVKGMNSARLD
jgi:hypothetical protein